MNKTFFSMDFAGEIPESEVSETLAGGFPVGCIERQGTSARLWYQDPNGDNVNKSMQVKVGMGIFDDCELGYSLICENFASMKQSKKPWK